VRRANLEALAEKRGAGGTLVARAARGRWRPVLGTTNHENLAMVEEIVAYGVARAREVICATRARLSTLPRDAEYACRCLPFGGPTGASWVVLCIPTAGSQPPRQFERGVEWMRAASTRSGSSATIRIHTHNGCSLAVANSLEGSWPRRLVQGTINADG